MAIFSATAVTQNGIFPSFHTEIQMDSVLHPFQGRYFFARGAY